MFSHILFIVFRINNIAKIIYIYSTYLSGAFLSFSKHFQCVTDQLIFSKKSTN